MSSKIEVCKTCNGTRIEYDGAGHTCTAYNGIAAPVIERQPDAIIEGCMTSVGITHAIYSSTVSLKDKEQVWLYREPPELAELQATIAQLTTEIERLKREEKNDAIAYKAAIEKQDELREDLKFERNANGELRAEIERLKGGQGELVAWKVEVDGMTLHHREPMNHPRAKNTPLYTSQPVPVSVVLPERECEDCFQNEQSEQAIGFNRAIDRFKELNQ